MLLGRLRARLASEAPELATALRQLGPRSVILSSRPRLLLQRRRWSLPNARVPVQVRDTTAAGDTFNAALAVALAEGRPSSAPALRQRRAAISVTRLGAQASAPPGPK